MIKKNGVNGRSSNEEISTRKNFIKEILDADSDITITTLKAMLRSRLIENGIGEDSIRIPTNETLKKHCLAVGYEYKDSKFFIKNIKSEYTKVISNIFKDQLKEISVDYKNETYIFYPFITTVHDRKFNSETNTHSIEITEKPNNSNFEQYYNELLYEMSNSIHTDFDNIQITIILNSHKNENILSEFFYNMLLHNISYISINLACIQLYCKKHDLDNIFNFLYGVIPDTIEIDSLYTYK